MSILRKKFLILIISLISFNNVILAMNKRFDKKGSPSIASKMHNSDNDWHPISYNTEIDHSLDNESKTKDISDKSTQFFHDITGTQSPHDKDIKSLAHRGLKLIKEQELEDKYKNLKELENPQNNGGAPLSLKIPNNNFNKPFSYGFVNPPIYENEQNIEQAQHHHSYHPQQPYSHNVQHHQPQHHDTGVIPYTNPDTTNPQDNYYQIHNPFAPHFEALTQARENAEKPNHHNQNHNPNQNQPRHQPSNPQSNSYDIGIHHTFQPSTQFIPSPGQHYNENVNEFSSPNVPHNQVHIQQFPGHPSDAYSHQQLYDGNPNENSPHFEALTAEKPSKKHSVRNQSSKNKKNNKKPNHTQHYGIMHEPSSTSSNCDGNSCERQNSQEYSTSFSTKSPHKNHHNSKKNHHHHHHNHETPDMVTLLNHKIYHDEEENVSSNSSPEDHSNHNSYQHSSHHSSNGKRSKKSKKPKRHHRGNPKVKHSMHSAQHPSEQYQMSEHPDNGRSYQVFEYPQESRITERIAEPLNNTTPISDIEKSRNHQKFNKKFEGQQQQHMDKEIKYRNQKLRQTPNKSNKNKIKNYDENVNATNTNTNDSKNYSPSPEYKFLINYRDENDRSDKNVHESDSSKSPSQAVDKEIRYFQDIYLAKKEPKYIEMGHKIENPEYLEERFEENDGKNQKFRGSVKWVTGNGEQGQQLWDLGH